MATAHAPASHTSRRWLIPWMLMAPGLLWLFFFFVIPSFQMFLTSLSTGSINDGFEFTWAFENYVYALTAFPDNIRNSLVYGGLATALCFLIGYPLAYGIAVRGGRHKSLLLFLVIAPFFTSFLIRTISWRIILGNDGPLLAVFRDGLGILPANFSVIGTPLAVVSGLVYQYLPFFVLPAYVAIEKIDHRLVEAARDLFAGPWRPRGFLVGGAVGAALGAFAMVGFGYAALDLAGFPGIAAGAVVGALVGAPIAGFLISEAFVRVTFPLSLPGVFAGTILVFIPIVGDYVNAELLGNPRTQMIGNVIQNRFLAQNDYPTAAALSFLLMAAILIMIFLYARALGTEELTGGSQLMTADVTNATDAGTGTSKPSGRAWKTVDQWLVPVFTALALIYLMIPIAVMILFSFNDPPGRFNFVWGEFSLEAWANPLGRPGLAAAMANTFIIAVLSTIVATVLGTLIGLALTRYDFRGRGATNTFIFIPMATPEIVMGASLLTIFVATAQDPLKTVTGGAFFPLGLQTILIAHIMFNISFVVVTVRARMQGFPRHLEEAAMDLGANGWTTFWKVTFPLILPGIAAAALLAFSLSIDDFVITQFTAGNQTTFPLWIWAAIRNNLPPQVHVIGTIIFVGSVLLVVLSTWWQGRSARNEARI